MSSTDHRFDVGDELEKIDSSLWKITNRMVDVDTDETLYRLRESDVGPGNYTDILTESQIERSFHTATDQTEGDR
jgi:hypothetical protein